MLYRTEQICLLLRKICSKALVNLVKNQVNLNLNITKNTRKKHERELLNMITSARSSCYIKLWKFSSEEIPLQPKIVCFIHGLSQHTCYNGDSIHLVWQFSILGQCEKKHFSPTHSAGWHR